jgi:hypothetical protein
MDSIDQMTLSFLMNKNTYNRYIEQTDPAKYKEQQEYRKKMRKYKDRILSITRRFLENPDLQITLEMNDMFSDYCKTCIKYFELKDLENSCSYEKDDQEEEEMMFDPEQMREYEENEQYENIENESMMGHADSVDHFLLGSNSVDEPRKKKSQAKYTLDAFMKQKR